MALSSPLLFISKRVGVSGREWTCIHVRTQRQDVAVDESVLTG